MIRKTNMGLPPLFGRTFELRDSTEGVPNLPGALSGEALTHGDVVVGDVIFGPLLSQPPVAQLQVPFDFPLHLVRAL
jgi:hypothetical protein